MSPIHNQRMTAEMDGDFVVFLIGMRINKPWKVHKWLPVFLGMFRMIHEFRCVALSREKWVIRSRFGQCDAPDHTMSVSQTTQVEPSQETIDAEGIRWVAPEVVDYLGIRTATREGAFFIPHLAPTMHLLDCGCGPGTITAGLAQIVAQGHVTGMDREAAELEQARRYAEQQGFANVTFQLGNLYEIPFPDDTFDAVFAHAVLQHLAEPARALQEMRRVLKPGGLIGVREEDRDADIIYPCPPPLRETHALLMRFWQEVGGDPYFPKHYRAVLREVGFTRIQMSASCEYRSTSAATRTWANVLTQFIRNPTFVELATSQGWADEKARDEMVVALQTWGDHPDAFWAETWCEAIGWKE